MAVEPIVRETQNTRIAQIVFKFIEKQMFIMIFHINKALLPHVVTYNIFKKYNSNIHTSFCQVTDIQNFIDIQIHDFIRL